MYRSARNIAQPTISVHGREVLSVAYEAYIDMRHNLTARSPKSPLDLLHGFARLQFRLMRLQQ